MNIKDLRNELKSIEKAMNKTMDIDEIIEHSTTWFELKLAMELNLMKNYLPIPEGIMSLRHLANWLEIKKVKNLVQVISDDVLITRLGKLSRSLINLKELKKCRWCQKIDGKWFINLKTLKKEIKSIRKERALRKENEKPLEVWEETTPTEFHKYTYLSPLALYARNGLSFGGANQ